MTKIGTILAASAILFALGCDDGRGNTDAGGIVLMDSGPGMMGTDAGPMMDPDSGPGMSSCSVTSQSEVLPAGCLPRCTSSTLSALNACAMDMMPAQCQQNALMADTTPPVNMDFMGMTAPLDCSGCFNWMANTCLFENCAAETSACQMCADGCDPNMVGCETEEMAIQACAATMPFQTCFMNRAINCFSR